jgi:formylglycine-generating enzyme required for sulfatase activity
MSHAMGVVFAGVLVAAASGSVAGAQSAPRRESKTGLIPAAAQARPGMARIPAGCFAMGDAFKEGVANEVPVHRVCLTKAFEVDVHEVTNAEYKASSMPSDARRQDHGESPVNDPPGPEPDCPVVRGGAWSGPPNYLRVAYRGNYSPTLQDNLIGFRCAR